MHTGRFGSSAAQAVGLAIGLGLIVVLVLAPPGMVFKTAFQQGLEEPGPMQIAPRGSLVVQTSALVILTLSIAMPLGTIAALLVFRTNVPGRAVWGFLLLLPALVPVELHATAWLATLGPQGLAKAFGIPLELKGLVGAAWVHAMVALPWIAGMVGAAARIVEPELEEECLLLVGPVRTMWLVTLRRSAGAVLAAALVVAVLTAGEMAVTDLLQVRSYAEAVYTDFALVGPVRAAATAVPGIALWLAIIFLAGWLIVRRVPQDLQALFARRAVFRLGPGRVPAAVACALLVTASMGVPFTSLVWRAGLKFPRRTVVMRPGQAAADAGPSDATRPHWSAVSFKENLVLSARSAGDQLRLSLTVAVSTALVTVPAAWILATLARGSKSWQAITAATACLLLAVPGPVIGIGVSQTLAWLAQAGNETGSLVEQGLAMLAGIAETPGVLVWLHCLRTLPYALAVLWPALRLVNRSLLEAATLDGAGVWGRFWHVDVPACRWAVAAAGLVCFVLSLGELGGSVIVTPPGQQPLSVRIFSFAHYGLESHLAGICLMLLAVVTAAATCTLLILHWRSTVAD